ncbi:MAG: ABC transporter permease [Mariprofundaceae bacterium]|nr:ABC transporter permease [Mariprofundaceae bacterium]
MLFLLAWRNVLRNARRSLITISAIAMGLSALLFLWGFNDGVHNAMMRNLQQVIIGSIQIHSDGYFRHPKLSRPIPDVNRVRQALATAGATRYTQRIRSFALAAGDDSSEGLVLLGVDPLQEVKVTRLHSKVSRGRFITAGDSNTCVMGATTARNLGLKLGDDLVLLAADRYGSLAADRFILVGIVESGEMGIDRGLAIVPLKALDTMLGMQGRITDIIVQLEPDRLEQVRDELVGLLADAPHGEHYEVLRWYDMYPMMKQWVELENAFYYIFLSVVLIIVAAGVMNTVLMSTLERMREFGIMLALGCGRWRLAVLVSIESVMLGLAGTLVGMTIGLSLVALFHRVGIDLSSQMESISRFYINPVIHTEIDTAHLLTTVASVLLAALLAALVPAWRASRLQPVEAIHHV